MSLSKLAQFRRWLAPPTFDDNEITEQANLQNIIFWGTIAIAICFGLITLLLEPEPWTRLLLTALWFLAAAGGLFLMRRGKVKQAGLFFSIFAWLILTFDAWLAGTVLSAGFTNYTVIIVLIGLLTGLRVALIFAGLSALSGLGLLYVEANDFLPSPLISASSASIWAALTSNFVAAAVLLYLANRSITAAFERARADEAALRISNDQLVAARTTLEEQSKELATVVETLEKQMTERQQLADSLQQSEADLRQLNAELEQRVQERTEELAKANEALTQEIAVRQQTEAALKDAFHVIEQAKQEWEITMDALPQLVCLIDRQGRVKRANRTIERWGLAPVAHVKDRQLVNLLHPDCRDPGCELRMFWDQAAQNLKRGRPAEFETDDPQLGRYLHCQLQPVPTDSAGQHTLADLLGVLVVHDITRRKQAEETLREQQDRLELAVAGTGGALWDEELDPAAAFDELAGTVYLSPEEKRLLGYADSEADDLPAAMSVWDRHVLPEDRAQREQYQRDHFEGRTEILDHEYRIRRVDGAVRWIQARSRIIRDEQGRPIRWIGIDWDVTERKQADEELRKLSSAVEQSPSTVVITDVEGRIEFVNPRFNQVTGYDGTEVLGRNPRLIKSGQHPPEFYQELWQTILAGRIWRGEIINRTKGGKLYWELASIAPIRDQAGHITHFVKVSEDITARKETEAELARYRNHLEELVNQRTAQLNQTNLNLRQSEERFRRVITSISDHIYVTEIAPDGKHLNLYISPNVETLTGYPPDRFLTDWELWSNEIIHPADRAAAAAQLTELDQGRPGEVEYRLTRRDGAVIWVRDSARVEDRENARIIYGVINDITARKETEAAIVRYSERLEILRQIEQGILSAQSVAEIGQSAMSRIRRLIPCHSATVTMFDDKANEAIVIAGEGEKPGQPVGLRRARFIQSGHPKERFNMLKQGEIIMLDEADLVRDYENVHNRSIRSVMVVPLLHQDDLVGTLNLSATKAGVFTPEHREIAHQVAGQLAIAIRQADLHAQTQQHAAQLEQRVADRVRELSALYEVTALASQAVELPVMLAQALEQILAAVRSEVGLIWLSDGEAQQRFHLAAQQGLSGEALGQVEVEMKEQGWLNQVAGQKQPLILPNLTQLPSNFPASLQAFVGLPIQAGGQMWGVFTIFGRTPRQFNLEDVALLTSVADQIGVAMENSRLRQQAREAAVMAERERLARDLHDSVTQSLYSLGLFAESGLEEVNSGHIEPARHYLTRIGETTQQALKEMRLMIYELRPADLERLGLVGALHRRLAAVEKRSGITARLSVEELIELPLPIEQEFYGIIQEALNNILKHAQATQVDVHLRRVEDMVELTISDNGQGFDPDGVETGGGLGLNGIRERVKMIDGTLTIHSAPAKGTIIEVQVKFSQT